MSSESQVYPASTEPTIGNLITSLLTRFLAFPRTMVVWVLLVAYTIFTLGPLVWMVMLSFRTNASIIQRPFELPTGIVWSNYVEVFERTNFVAYFMNSALVVSVALVGIILFASMAAYALARFQFRLSEPLFWAFMSTLMIPHQVVLVPLFKTLAPLGLLDTRQGLIAVYISFSLPLSLYILRAFFQQLPGELMESAKIDGAGEWTIFWRVAFPLALPAVATVTVFNFISLWNEFLFAVVFIHDDNLRTLPLGQMQFVGEYTDDLAGMAAALTLATLPVLVLYIVLAEQFQKGMTAGAMKG